MAQGNAIAPKIPMVVLVDRDTASAAEIVTGALKDHGRAKVVGTHTYGKGVFQEIEPLPERRRARHHGRRVLHAQRPEPRRRRRPRGRRDRPERLCVDNPRAPGDQALTVAERVVAAKTR